MFALGSDSKKQEVKLPLIGYKPDYGNNNIDARMLVKARDEIMSRKLFSYSYGWGNIETIEVVAQSSYQFTEEWFNQSPTEDIDYALKKWTQDQMNDFLQNCRELIVNFGGDYGIS